MNLVALLIAPAVVTLALDGKDTIRWAISTVSVTIIIGAIINSKRRAITVGEE